MSAMLYSSARAATTKCHRLGGLQNRHLFPVVLEAGKSKVRGVLADQVLSESPHTGLQTAAFFLCLHKRGQGRGWGGEMGS